MDANNYIPSKTGVFMHKRKAAITLCASDRFLNILPTIEGALVRRGFKVFPSSLMARHHSNEATPMEMYFDFLMDQFRNIERSDAIYVANFDKDKIGRCIGGSNFLAMGNAFFRNVPIFLMFPPPVIGYRREILAMRPIVIGMDWDELERRLMDRTRTEYNWRSRYRLF